MTQLLAFDSEERARLERVRLRRALDAQTYEIMQQFARERDQEALSALPQITRGGGGRFQNTLSSGQIL